MGQMNVINDRLLETGLKGVDGHIRDWDACLADPVLADLLAQLPGDAGEWVELMLESDPATADRILERARAAGATSLAQTLGLDEMEDPLSVERD